LRHPVGAEREGKKNTHEGGGGGRRKTPAVHYDFLVLLRRDESRGVGKEGREEKATRGGEKKGEKKGQPFLVNHVCVLRSSQPDGEKRRGNNSQEGEKKTRHRALPAALPLLLKEKNGRQGRERKRGKKNCWTSLVHRAKAGEKE